MTDWPNLFVAGAPRSGTTSLWAYLGQHPDVFMAAVKEPHFFSGHTTGSAVHDRDEYLALFSGRRERWRGEASPSYLWHPAAAPAILEANRHARIILSLRDPIERAHSMYSFLHRYGREGRSFPEAVRADLARTDVAMPASYFVGRSLYAAGIERFLELFGGSQVLVLVFEELIADTRAAMVDVFTFLELDPSPAETLREGAHNSSAPPRNRAAAAVLALGPVRRFGQRLVPPSARAAVENRMLKGAAPSEQVDPETRALLAGAFAADRIRLEELLGRELPWPRAGQPD